MIVPAAIAGGEHPGLLARENPVVLEHEGADLLPVHPQGLDRRSAGAHKVAHRFVALVGDPHRRELPGAQQSGQCHRVTAVGLHPLAGLPWDERWCHHRAGLTQVGDEPMQMVAGWSGLVAEVRTTMLGCNAPDQAAHALVRRLDFADVAHFPTAPTIRDRNRVAHLCDIDPDENLSTFSHDSSSLRSPLAQAI
jgi:hypothetical protein